MGNVRVEPMGAQYSSAGEISFANFLTVGSAIHFSRLHYNGLLSTNQMLYQRHLHGLMVVTRFADNSKYL